MSELKKPAALQFRHNNSDGFVAGYEREEMDKYLSEVDRVIAKLKADYADLRDDKKLTDTILDERNAEIAKLKADYDEVRDRLQTANLIKDEQKAKADKLLSCLKYLVMGDLIKDCPPKKVASEIVKEYGSW